MIDHVTIYVKDLSKSRLFYLQAFKPLGYTIAFEKEEIFCAFDIGSGSLFEIAQYQGNEPITRCHVAFRAASEDQIREFHASALQAGGIDHGAPGPRPEYTQNYYACFILDPDGHNIELMHDQWKTVSAF